MDDQAKNDFKWFGEGFDGFPKNLPDDTVEYCLFVIDEKLDSIATIKARLNEILEAFNACTDLGLDVQLKVLQALPSLLQNYASDLEGDLLSLTLQVCSSLQSAKASTVSGVAAATLQQLVATVFERVVSEDGRQTGVPATVEIPGDNGNVKLRPAAFDAYRLFYDLALVAEEHKTGFVQFTSLSVESSLELITHPAGPRAIWMSAEVPVGAERILYLPPQAQTQHRIWSCRTFEDTGEDHVRNDDTTHCHTRG